MFNIKKKLGAVALLALFTMGSANALVLDTFDYTVDLEVNALNLAATDTATTILGFQADYDLSYGGSNTDYTSDATADTVNIVGMSDGELAYASAGVTSSSLQIIWSDPTATSFFDFTEGGINQGIYIDLESVDLSFLLDMTVTYFTGVYDQAMNPVLANVTFGTTVDTSINTPTRLFYAFSNWGGVDFTQVAAVTANIYGVPDADFRISEVGAIPEPGTLAIFGLALVGLAFGSRKKA